MKRSVLTSVLLLAFGSSHAVAQLPCPAGLTGAQLVTTLSGMYACAKRAPGNPANDIWNELHQGTTAAGGNVMDYKRGPGHPVDPSKVVGTYFISLGANTVTYTYGDPGGPYTYSLRTVPNPDPNSPGFQYCNVATGERIPAIISATPIHLFCTAP